MCQHHHQHQVPRYTSPTDSISANNAYCITYSLCQQKLIEGKMFAILVEAAHCPYKLTFFHYMVSNIIKWSV